MKMLAMLLLAQAETGTLTVPETPVEAAPSQAWGVAAILIMLAVIVLPFVVGGLIARGLKMREKATAIGAVLFAITLASMPFVTRLATGQDPLSAIKLGIDLAGGANMVFQVDRSRAKEVTNEIMDQMVDAISKRVNLTGTEEVTVRKVGVDRIEVIVPGADAERREQVRKQIVNLGNLEFAILANTVNHTAIIARADAAGPNTELIRDANGNLIAKWRRPALDADGVPKLEGGGNNVHFRQKTIDGKTVTEYLVVVDPDPKRWLTGEYLVNVREQIGETGLVVAFTFNTRGGQLMQELTTRNQPQPGAGWKSQLAVLLNEEIHSAPTINSVIGATGEIQGRFTQEEIDELVSVLNAGALTVPLLEKPVSEFTVSPLLGEDVKQKGLMSMGLSLIAVFLITVFYYRKPGIVAVLCLMLNFLLVLGAMSLISATFTLPGLAGLVLSVAMAVDSNVLIYERMREEQAKGSSLRMSIKNGFEKAFGTIFDSNVTTLITAVVLYYVGTDQVKGFAVTLFIGIVISMFTAVFVGRLIFDIAEHKRWFTDLKMMNLVRATRFDFLSGTKVAVGVSLLLIAVGLVAVGVRGKDNFDIDFRGGSMVTFKFEGAPPTQAEVTKALQGQFPDTISVEELGDVAAGKEIMFRMRTIEANAEEVSQKVKQAFAGGPHQLVQQHVTLGEVTAIPPAADAVAAAVDPFAGGHEVQVALTEPMLPSSLAEEAAAQLALLNFNQPQELVQGIQTEEGGVKLEQVKLRVAAAVPADSVTTMLNGLKAELEKEPHFEEVNTFDSAVAGNTQRAALAAMFFSVLAIVAYLWVRFQRVSFGLAASIALLHDVLITIGLVALGAYLSGTPIGSLFVLEDFKINLPLVAAFLTIIGYSINDTIVIFDRIREVRGRNPALTRQMINQSLNQTFSRTLLTSTTTLISTMILYFFGGDGIHGFAYSLTLGIIVGTFSSMFIAAPVLMWLANREMGRVASA